MHELHCPVCHLEFACNVWDDGECPNCNNEYHWDCGYSHELDDEIIDVVWEYYE